MGYNEEKQKLIKRLKRIDGQINGIMNMIEENRECADTLNQIKAAKSGLSAVASELVKLEATNCLECSDDPGKQSAEIIKLANNIFKIT